MSLEHRTAQEDTAFFYTIGIDGKGNGKRRRSEFHGLTCENLTELCLDFKGLGVHFHIIQGVLGLPGIPGAAFQVRQPGRKPPGDIRDTVLDNLFHVVVGV